MIPMGSSAGGDRHSTALLARSMTRAPAPPLGQEALPSAGPPSKTRLKQLAHEVQKLGEAAAALPETRLDTLPVPDTVRAAIRELRRTRSHEGRRRQLQYLGKLLRGIDVAPLQEALAEAQLPGARASLALHRAERWRLELIADDAAATRWIAGHTGADAQQLRSLVRAARRDAALAPEQRSGRAFRELFQFIKAEANDDDA